MQRFEYCAPESVEAAVQVLAKHGAKAKVLAGGTDILVQLREGMRQADVVVDVKKIPGLTDYQFDAKSGLRIGAACPCHKLYEDSAVVAAYPALGDSTTIIGGWQIQSRASVGGNLCNASPAADSIPSLLALGAVCEIAGPSGRRELAASEFCKAPGRNSLGDGELLVAIRLPAPAPRAGSAYQRFIPRNEMDIAVVGAASWLRLDGDKIADCRIALAAVAPTPVLAEAAAKSLVGQAPSEQAFAAAGELAKHSASPISDMRGTAEYRTHLVGVLVRRTLADAHRRATI